MSGEVPSNVGPLVRCSGRKRDLGFDRCVCGAEIGMGLVAKYYLNVIPLLMSAVAAFRIGSTSKPSSEKAQDASAKL